MICICYNAHWFLIAVGPIYGLLQPDVGPRISQGIDIIRWRPGISRRGSKNMEQFITGSDVITNTVNIQICARSPVSNLTLGE